MLSYLNHYVNRVSFYSSSVKYHTTIPRAREMHPYKFAVRILHPTVPAYWATMILSGIVSTVLLRRLTRRHGVLHSDGIVGAELSNRAALPGSSINSRDAPSGNATSTSHLENPTISP